MKGTCPDLKVASKLNKMSPFLQLTYFCWLSNVQSKYDSEFSSLNRGGVVCDGQFVVLGVAAMSVRNDSFAIYW